MAISNPLTSLFGANPFRSLQEHMQHAMACADAIPTLFEAVAAGDREAVERIKDRIFDEEAKADLVKNDLREHLPRGLFLPVNRSDLLEILDYQDSIADVAQDIAGMLYERSMTIPEPMKADLGPFIARCVDTCRQASAIIAQLDELLELGFRGREVTHVEEMISELNRMEDETDDMGMDLARQLFRIEDQLNPVSVMFWHRLLDWIGDLADNAEKVGNRIRLFIAR